MNQEPTQDQITLLTNAIEAIHNELVVRHAERILPFDDIIFNAFVGDCGYAFVAMKVENCPERDLPWIGWDDSHAREYWSSTIEVKNKTKICLDNMMLDVSEQAKTIYSTFLI